MPSDSSFLPLFKATCQTAKQTTRAGINTYADGASV